MTSPRIHASTVSLRRGARRAVTALSADDGRLTAVREDGGTRTLVRVSDIRAVGIMQAFDVPPEALPLSIPLWETLVWFETPTSIVVLPVSEWFPGSTPLLPHKALTSSGVSALLEEFSAPRARHGATWPSDRPVEVISSTPEMQVEAGPRRIVLAVLVLAVVPYPLFLVLVVAAALGAPGSDGLLAALTHVTAANCAVAALLAALPVIAWIPSKAARHRGSLRTLGIHPSGLRLLLGDGSLVVRDVDGVERRYEAGTGRTGALTTWHLSAGARPLLRMWDREGTPRLRLRFPTERDAPGLARDLSRVLTDHGLEDRKGKIGGEWPELLPERAEYGDFFDALVGSGSRWRVPSLVSSIALFAACGAFSVPFLVLDPVSSWQRASGAVGVTSLVIAFLLVLATVLSCPARHLLARWRWARDVRRRRRECS